MTNVYETINLLPYDGAAFYHGQIMTEAEALFYFQSLLAQIAWQSEEAIIYGRHITTKRKVAWYGNASYTYKYSGVSKQAIMWTKELYQLKQLTESISGETFNSCLLNLYHSGDEGMGWHSDNEASIQENSTIASISLGAERKFSFRHKKSKEVISLTLQNGSFLIMKKDTQTHWHHSLPKSKKVSELRINLTFRKMKE